jgi:beta-glucosidase
VYADDLKRVVQGNAASLGLLDEAVLRLLQVKESLGLFDKPLQYHDVSREQRTLLASEHRKAAREIARQSLVLLKNESQSLPLVASRVGTLGVIGSLADDRMSMLGSWRAQGRPEDVVTILEGLRANAPKNMRVTYAAGADPRSADLAGIPAALDAARTADAILLVIGEHFDLSGEARSRADIGLPKSQLELARQIMELDKPVIVLLVTGRPFAMPTIAEHADAILNTWMLGVEAGNAVADAVYGRYSPAGRLPAAFPRSTGQVPFYFGANPTGRPPHEDLAKDTARYMDEAITPQFPFGHGLTYSSFAYADLKQSTAHLEPNAKLTISFSLTNSGTVASDEVPQLYVRDPVASIARPVKELRGFARVTLAPGETKRVSFTLSPEQFALFDSKSAWTVEPGMIEFMIGASSADIRLRGSVEIAREMRGSAPAAALATEVSVTNSRLEGRP